MWPFKTVEQKIRGLENKIAEQTADKEHIEATLADIAEKLQAKLQAAKEANIEVSAAALAELDKRTSFLALVNAKLAARIEKLSIRCEALKAKQATA